jgi:N-hydroxyarylamine O-acetyltransferase
MNVNAYLDRIGYRGPLSPDASTLRGLHVAHMLAVPFENLDIHRGREIVLSESRFYDKIVRERRGGFCYEMNGLFAWLLRELGFSVELISAGVARASGGFGPDFDHLVLVVELEERWLADVGFGEGFREPLRLSSEGEQRQHGRVYRLSDSNLWQLEDDGWKSQYRYSLSPRRLSEYEAMCRYHQTSPESHFTRGRLCSQATPEGRVTLTDRRLTITDAGGRQERDISGEEAFIAALREHFGISLPV